MSISALNRLVVYTLTGGLIVGLAAVWWHAAHGTLEELLVQVGNLELTGLEWLLLVPGVILAGLIVFALREVLLGHPASQFGEPWEKKLRRWSGSVLGRRTRSIEQYWEARCRERAARLSRDWRAPTSPPPGLDVRSFAVGYLLAQDAVETVGYATQLYFASLLVSQSAAVVAGFAVAVPVWALVTGRPSLPWLIVPVVGAALVALLRRLAKEEDAWCRITVYRFMEFRESGRIPGQLPGTPVAPTFPPQRDSVRESRSPGI